MKSIATVAIAAAIAAVAGHAVAQSAQPLTRAEVKAETRALEKARKLTPAREGVRPYQAPGASTKTRAERKSETLAARKSGQLEPAGDKGDVKTEKLLMSAPPTITRAERKADTRAAEKQGRLIPAGEGPDAPRK